MPIYHLHLHNVHVDADDEEGHDLPDLPAARQKALNGIREFLGHELMMNGEVDLRGQVDIADDMETVLETITFAEAVSIIGQ